jgi:hypothetical protein
MYPRPISHIPQKPRLRTTRCETEALPPHGGGGKASYRDYLLIGLLGCLGSLVVSPLAMRGGSRCVLLCLVVTALTVLVSRFLMMMFGCCVMTSRYDMSFGSGILHRVCHGKVPFRCWGRNLETSDPTKEASETTHGGHRVLAS